MRTARSTASPLAWIVALALVGIVAFAGQGTAHASPYMGLSNQASASGFPAGVNIYDSAMVTGGDYPNGYLIFSMYGPADPTCAGTPLFMSYLWITGSGYYESARFTTNTAGTYRWTAAYSGDGRNTTPPPTTCSDPAGQVSVSKAGPVLTTSAAWVAPSATNTAVISMGSGPTGPTGTLTFQVYGPNNTTCAGAPAFTTTRTITGPGAYTSAPFTPTAAGSYQFVVGYSGDANNDARSSTCAESASRFMATGGGSTVVAATPTAASRGGTVSASWAGIATPTSGDWVALYKVGTYDGGPVVAWKYTGGAASGSASLKFSWAAPAGTYELRMMANNSIQRLATSAPITLTW